MQRWPLRQVAFIGLGLIGSSLARLMRERGLVERITAASRSQQTLATAQQLGIIDIGYSNPADAVRGADLVILAMPVNATEAVMAAIKPALSSNAIVTDVGSTKGNVITAAKAVWGHVPENFVPGHPIAGSEQSGVMAGRADLFSAHKVILTPLEHTRAEAVELVTAIWQAAGADVMTMSVAQHDAVLARTSHLPHLLAFSLVDTLAQESDNLDIFRYAAGGFRDFTRIAASDPLMWHDIFLANREAVLSALDVFEAGTKRLREAINNENGDALLGVFTRARAAREHFTHMLAGTAYAKSMTQNKELRFTVEPGGTFTGRARVPGDKSISHRSIMLGSIAEGITEVTGFLEGEDALATLQAFRDMGVVIEGPHEGRVRVHGVGLNGLKAPPSTIYVGNSGTTMRLLSGLLSAQGFNSVLTGDASLAKRPMERIAKPLRLMGADIQTTGERGTPPVTITGNAKLRGIHYDLPVASAQVKSGVLLAGLWADGTTSVTEPAPTRDHTERMLRGFGYDVKTNGATASLQGGGSLKACKIDVPGDISSAAFFLVAASIAPNSDLVLEHVGMNPTRVGVVNILRAMGGNIDVLNAREVGGEPVADLRVRSAQLQGIDIPEDQVPLGIDEFPALFIAAACANGVTTLTGAEELRVKESDRIQVMADGLVTLGVSALPTTDGIVITGGPIGGGEVVSHGDHRIAMAFAMAGLRATDTITIRDCANVATSFPDFIGLAHRCGLRIRASEHVLH